MADFTFSYIGDGHPVTDLNERLHKINIELFLVYTSDGRVLGYSDQAEWPTTFIGNSWEEAEAYVTALEKLEANKRH